MMASGVVEKVRHVHYNHTDPSRHLRWTARESYLYMLQRPWQGVVDFYSDLVQGHASLRDLFPSNEGYVRKQVIDQVNGEQEMPLSSNGNLSMEAMSESLEDSKDPQIAETCVIESGRWARATFEIVLSYHGSSFDGWQKQPGLNTVQGAVEKSLGQFVDEKKAKQLLEKCRPVEPCAVVAGRTDKGVTALRQVCSFYSWRKDICTKHIAEAINSAAPGKLRALHICKVSRVFHPNFTAKWRRYLYIFPLNDNEEEAIAFSNSTSPTIDALDVEQFGENAKLDGGKIDCSNDTYDGKDAVLMGLKPKSFCIEKVNELLQQLEAKSLSYKMFARDTKASRNVGSATECFLFHARAMESRLPCANKVYLDGQRVMCVELVGNRFLRKMVRVIVATAVREAAAGCSNEALLSLMDATCRRATAPPAPPDGLCLVEVGYKEFSKDDCLIPWCLQR